MSQRRMPGRRSAVCSENGAVDIRVVGVDRGRTGDVDLGEPACVVQTRPVVLGEDHGDLAVGLKIGRVLEVPREQVLAGEQDRLAAEVVGLDSLGRPPCAPAIGVARFV